MKFRNKVVLVTGAQEGIGRNMALAFAEEGGKIAINWLDNRGKAEEVAEAAKNFGSQTELIQGNISKIHDVHKVVNSTFKTFGKIDILINNAGIFPRVPFLEMDEANWDNVINTNLKGSFFCAQAAAKYMIKSGNRGSIINLASQAIQGHAPNSVHYTSSKTGIVGMTRAIAREIAHYGIRVNCIAPGLTDTAQPRYGHTEAELVEMAKEIPLGRLIQPEEIAKMALFLCSDHAKMITGQTYHINGGTYAPG
ncbi:MAG: beta-ketoacyl-ACP reductase [Magnetovibrio sp.]|nr:beta-ketoacyl-ACP reductase [Magnetovibrio sp.]|tara:strand:- start:803 stop:1558 length:756 start_codon:yes stop_codon:yes gene_type:complete